MRMRGLKRNGPASDQRTPYIDPICGRATYVTRTAGSRASENRPAVANPVRDCTEGLHIRLGIAATF